MKIAFFSEGNYTGKVKQEQLGRTDLNWVWALDADHYNINNVPTNLQYDYGVYIIPKKVPHISEAKFDELRKICTNVGVMQEGNHTYYQDWNVLVAFSYLERLQNCDFILCHNEIDLNYYSGIFPQIPVHILPTLLVDVNINKVQITPEYKRSGVLLSGNFTQWYSGIDSYLVGGVFNEPLFAPSMGRMQEAEKQIEDLTHIPYSNWNDWFYKLSEMRYGVNMMRTYAAGSFSLACGYLGIPCIGYKPLDTQKILFPELSVDEGDMKKAIKIAKHLRDNKQFYNHVSAYAQKAYQDNYSLEAFNQKTKEIFV